MDLRKLRYFVATAEELHFGRAARRLGLSQPPLSMQLRALELDLGAKLFDRDNRSVALTHVGAVLLVEARKILRQVDQARVLVERTARESMARCRWASSRLSSTRSCRLF